MGETLKSLQPHINQRARQGTALLGRPETFYQTAWIRKLMPTIKSATYLMQALTYWRPFLPLRFRENTFDLVHGSDPTDTAATDPAYISVN
jgi:hypothetical protein